VIFVGPPRANLHQNQDASGVSVDGQPATDSGGDDHRWRLPFPVRGSARLPRAGAAGGARTDRPQDGFAQARLGPRPGSDNADTFTGPEVPDVVGHEERRAGAYGSREERNVLGQAVSPFPILGAEG